MQWYRQRHLCHAQVRTTSTTTTRARWVKRVHSSGNRSTRVWRLSRKSMANASQEPPGGGDSAVCASGIATSAQRCRWPSQLQRITAGSRTKRYGDRGRRGQERWRSRTSTKRYDDRRLLHRGSGPSLLRRCPSRRRGSGGTRGLASSWCSNPPWCRSWHERTRGRWRRSGSSWLTNAPARPTSGTRSHTPPLGAV